MVERTECQDLTDRLFAEWKKLEEQYLQLYSVLMEVGPLVKDNKSALPDLVDLGFVCREVAKGSDDIRKDATSHQDLIGKVIAMRHTRDSIGKVNPDMKIVGELATGKPDVKQRAAIPKRGTQEYSDLCAHFGVTEEAVSSGLVSFHFVKTRDYVSDLMAEGLPLPKGLGGITSEFSTSFIRKSNGKK
jgi:hypothetical protein